MNKFLFKCCREYEHHEIPEGSIKRPKLSVTTLPFPNELKTDAT